MKRTIKCVCVLIIIAMMTAMAGTAFAEPDYYHIGLEITDLMSEAVGSEAYLSLIGWSESMGEVREIVDTGDYDQPVAVYSISMSEKALQDFLRNALVQSPKNNEAYNSLSDRLQELVRNRISIQAVCTAVNARMGTPYIAFTSLSQVFVRNEALTDEKGACYLYIFEKGTPILVTFGYHGASAMFLFIPKEQQGSVNGIRKELQNLTIEPVLPAE